MIKLLALAVVLALLVPIDSLGHSAKEKKIRVKAEQATYTIKVGNGVCSSTAVQKNVLLTAEHCLPNKEASLRINGKPAKVLKTEADGKDHLLLMVDISFKSFVSISKTKPEKGDVFFFFGNPVIDSPLTGLYRQGYFAGYHLDMIVLDMNSWFGDSGAGLFNVDGELVCAVTDLYGVGIFKLTATYPLAFTKEQYERFGL